MKRDLLNIIFERLLKIEGINSLLKNKYLPRWVIFIFDIFIVISAFYISYILRYSIATLKLDTVLVLRQMFIVVGVYSICFIFIRPFSGIIRHTTSHDIQRLFISVLASSAVLFILTETSRLILKSDILNVPLSVIMIQMMVTATLLTLSRIIIKYIYNFITRLNEEKIPVMIYGAGELGHATRLAMERSVKPSYQIVGFIDINKTMQGKERSGIRIYSPEAAINRIILPNKVTEIIIAINPAKIDRDEADRVFSFCLENKIILRKVPPINEWLNGSFEARQIRKISIDDLLTREEIKLDINRIQEGLAGKTILVTGAAGSIGSEIVRQLIAFKTGKIILLDQAESALYDLQMELSHKYNGSREFGLVIADISDPARIEQIFSTFKPQIVFNAAAYKHVPLLEDNVYEAVRVNVGGTKLLAELAVKYCVEKFVMISSDKAVNPTNVMGATKRICELYVQSMAQDRGCSTQFITTRFGNVLGSNGSVVPLFSRQIEAGGPITLTHRDVKRYFMTIPEACQLVLEAGFMGNGGEIYVFDMGDPVKIYDLALKMISLAGLEPGKDIRIIETGLRPGEKLFEEVLADREHNLPTHNPKILIAAMSETDPAAIRRQVSDLLAAAPGETECELVGRIREIVREFEPQNPKFRVQL